jgi:hypothetical protein
MKETVLVWGKMSSRSLILIDRHVRIEKVSRGNTLTSQFLRKVAETPKFLTNQASNPPSPARRLLNLGNRQWPHHNVNQSQPTRETG